MNAGPGLSFFSSSRFLSSTGTFAAAEGHRRGRRRRNVTLLVHSCSCISDDRLFLSQCSPSFMAGFLHCRQHLAHVFPAPCPRLHVLSTPRQTGVRGNSRTPTVRAQCAIARCVNRRWSFLFGLPIALVSERPAHCFDSFCSSAASVTRPVTRFLSRRSATFKRRVFTFQHRLLDVSSSGLP